jgi:hypothetical protein
MASFLAMPASIEKYGGLISRAGQSASETQKYLREHDPDIGGAFGWAWSKVQPPHDAAIEATERMLKHLTTIATESDTALNKTANHYRYTEHAVATRVDATYPKVPLTPSQRDLTESRYGELTGRPLATQNFADAIDAPSALKEPESAELNVFESLEVHPGGLFDYLSPSNAALHVVQLVIHHDPLQWFTEWFAGDWKKTYEYGNVLENIGTMMGAVSTNVHRGTNELRETWMGNAADTAYKYFGNLADAVAEQQELLGHLGHQYKLVSMGILRMQDTALSLIKGMLDAALIGAIGASGGAATAETGVGALAGGLIVGVEAVRIWEMWERATILPGKGLQAINAFIGFLQSSSSTMTHFAQHPLPANGYQSPAA